MRGHRLVLMGRERCDARAELADRVAQCKEGQVRAHSACAHFVNLQTHEDSVPGEDTAAQARLEGGAAVCESGEL